MHNLLHKSMISGVITAILGLTIFLLTLHTDVENNALAWLTLIISIEAGLIITLIVDQKTKESHEEVMTSQGQIQTLLEKLKETDQKHNEALSALNKSRELNEDLAEKSLITTLQYVIDMLNKLFKVIDPENVKDGDNELVIKLLKHLESPLNLMMQSTQQIGLRLIDQKDKLISNIEIQRKLVIASIVVSDSETKRTLELLKKSKENFEQILKNINENK